MSGSVEKWSPELYAKHEAWHLMDLGRRNYNKFADRARNVSFPDEVKQDIRSIEALLAFRPFSDSEREELENLLQPTKKLSREEAMYAQSYMGVLLDVQEFPEKKRKAYRDLLGSEKYLYKQLSLHTHLTAVYADMFHIPSDTVEAALMRRGKQDKAQRLLAMRQPIRETIFHIRDVMTLDTEIWTELYTKIGKVRQKELFEFLAPSGYPFSEIRMLIGDQFPRYNRDGS